MEGFSVRETSQGGLSAKQIDAALTKSFETMTELPERVLLIVPDYTRFYSGAGLLAERCYGYFSQKSEVDLLVALGTHEHMTESEIRHMYKGIPSGRFIMHNWREDTVRLGEISAEFVSDVSGGLVSHAIDVEVNRAIVSGDYQLIISIGQVVPHEVIGMANHSKNIFVGCGGAEMINSTHMLGAFVGLESIMGRDHSAVRKVLDKAASDYLAELPLYYLLSVTTMDEGGDTVFHGVHFGKERSYFEAAVSQAQQKNLILLDKPLRKVVVHLDENEYKSCWLGNKSIYRTRMAIADGGELIILAPGVCRFGEDEEIDRLIREYGYVGRERIIEFSRSQADLRENLSAAAHLIHGSSDGRFSICYATRHLSGEEVEAVGFLHMPCDEAMRRYNPESLSPGINTLPDGEQVFYIANPALGLWADRARFEESNDVTV